MSLVSKGLDMLGAGWVKWALVGLAALAVAGTIYAGYTYVTNLQEDNAALHAEVSAKEVQLAVQADTLDQMREGYDVLLQHQVAMQDAVNELARGQEATRRAVTVLEDTFRRHDLAKLSEAKPGLIERRINYGTADADRLWGGLGADDGGGPPGEAGAAADVPPGHATATGGDGPARPVGGAPVGDGD